MGSATAATPVHLHGGGGDQAYGTNTAVKVKHRCAHCGHGVMRLLVQYSPGNIRLMKCDSCKLVADPYVECELMILLIDLILHKEKAYRHLLYNMLPDDKTFHQGLLWKSTLMFLVFDGCRSLFVSGVQEIWDLSSSSSTFKVLAAILVANSLFFGTLIYMIKTLLPSSLDKERCKEVFLATVFSSYFRIFVVTMMVWEFPPGTIFIVDIFVLSSNAVALKVLTQLSGRCCIGVCLVANIIKLIAYTLMLGLPS